jgi:hypothetical protein
MDREDKIQSDPNYHGFNKSYVAYWGSRPITTNVMYLLDISEKIIKDVQGNVYSAIRGQVF